MSYVCVSPHGVVGGEKEKAWHYMPFIEHLLPIRHHAKYFKYLIPFNIYSDSKKYFFILYISCGRLYFPVSPPCQPLPFHRFFLRFDTCFTEWWNLCSFPFDLVGLLTMAEVTLCDSKGRPWKITHLMSACLWTLALGTQIPCCEEAQAAHGESMCMYTEQQPQLLAKWVESLQTIPPQGCQAIHSLLVFPSEVLDILLCLFSNSLTHEHNKIVVVLYHKFGVDCFAAIITEALSCKTSCPGSHSKLVLRGRIIVRCNSRGSCS